MSLASGEGCPPQAPPGVGAGTQETPTTQPIVVTVDDPLAEYVGFTSGTGSVSTLATVRRPLARVLGRYLLGEPVAAGGMATVHLGRLLGPAGFSRTVAVKRLHAHLAANPELVQRFMDEARIASRIRHTNVVQTLDVVAVDSELLLVMDYVHGESFSRLRRLATDAGGAIPSRVVSAIVIGVLRGLHAAHESKSAKGTPLDVVHRDVSPQNILVGADGVARVLDFGIAKAQGRASETVSRDIKGKLAYMPPEQLSGESLDRRADLFAVGVVLWEALAGQRLFRGEDAVSTVDAIYNRQPPRLSKRDLGIPSAVDDVLARALAKDPDDRFETAGAMARALEGALSPASDREVAEWIEDVAGAELSARARQVAAFEGDDTGGSQARLFASHPQGDPSLTARRDALAPPPLGAMLPEPTTMSRPPGSLATCQRDSIAVPAGIEAEAEAALAATGVLSRLDAPGSFPLDGVTEQRALHTPLVMVAPSEPTSPGSASDAKTALGDRRAASMPTSTAGRQKTRRAPSVWRLAMLVVLPPFFVAMGLVGAKPLRRAVAESLAPPTAASSPQAAAPSTAPPLPVASAAPPVAADEAKADADAKAKANATADEAKARPDAREANARTNADEAKPRTKADEAKASANADEAKTKADEAKVRAEAVRRTEPKPRPQRRGTRPVPAHRR